MKKFKISINDQNRTILKFLEKMLGDVPKSKIEKLFRNKDIKINGKRIKDKTIILNQGDEVTVYSVISSFQGKKYVPVQRNFTVIYEDDNILVVNKSNGVETHGAKGSLDDQILHYLKFKQTDSFIPSSIGRLDKVTSGLIVYAKNYLTLRQLKNNQKDWDKVYLFKSDLDRDITTEFKIIHDENKKREVCGTEGKPTKTIFWIEKKRKYAKIITGRKHQIRSSLSKLGFPIWGDTKYGGKPAERVYLHSFSIKINGIKNKELNYLEGMEFVSQPIWK